MTIREHVADFLTGGQVSALRETATQLSVESQQNAMTTRHLRESIVELEANLNREGWELVTGDAQAKEFSAKALQQIRRLSLLMYLKNPIVQRGVKVQAFYVFGQGVTVHSQDDGAKRVLQEFWDDTRNRRELTDSASLQEKEREQQITGEHFFVFFTNSVTGRVRVATFDPDEIEDVITNPDDDKEPWFYKRTWTSTQRDLDSGKSTTTTQTAYYPDWNHNPPQKRKTIGAHTVRWGEDVYHIKTGGTSRMTRGVSEIYSQIDWARAYSEFLENRATVAKVLARFTHKAKAVTKAGVQAVKKRLSSTLGRPDVEANPAPAAPSVAVMGEGRDIEAMNVKGATVNPDEGRRFMLMVCAGKGLPETFYGDASVGTLATAESLDWPTALMMLERQGFWATVFKNIATYVLIKAHRAPSNPFRATVKYNGQTPEIIGLDQKPITVDVDFPEIVKTNVKDRITAINLGAKYIPNPRELCRLTLKALNVPDIDEKLDLFFNEDGTPKYTPPQTAAPANAPAPASAPASAPNPAV